MASYNPPHEPNHPFPRTPETDDGPFEASVQCLRSLSAWSGGINHTECSIQKAYVELIGRAERFVYIENQFFTTTVEHNGKKGQAAIHNGIGTAIVDRIVKAHENRENFKIYTMFDIICLKYHFYQRSPSVEYCVVGYGSYQY